MAVRALKQTGSRSIEAALEYISKMGYLDPRNEQIVRVIKQTSSGKCGCSLHFIPKLSPGLMLCRIWKQLGSCLDPVKCGFSRDKRSLTCGLCGNIYFKFHSQSAKVWCNQIEALQQFHCILLLKGLKWEFERKYWMWEFCLVDSTKRKEIVFYHKYGCSRILVLKNHVAFHSYSSFHFLISGSVQMHR